jgi:hypothetical protein
MCYTTTARFAARTMRFVPQHLHTLMRGCVGENSVVLRSLLSFKKSGGGLMHTYFEGLFGFSEFR